MLSVDKLTKSYSGLTAVDAISFEVNGGDVLGFLGPNGAGKTTTMQAICGFLHFDSGSISVCGYDIQRDNIEVKNIVGYLPEGAPCFDEMTVNEFLNFVCAIRHLEGTRKKQRRDYVFEELSLNQVRHQRIGTLSKGFKRRVGLAQALIHDPKVLIMDEPTDGLDPNQKRHVRALIRSLSKEKIVVISTHILEEVVSVCNRALIISEGKIRANSTPMELLKRSKYSKAVSFCVHNPREVMKICSFCGGQTHEMDEVHGRGYVFFSGEAQVKAGFEKLRTQTSFKVADLRLESGRMDDVFRTITEG